MLWKILQQLSRIIVLRIKVRMNSDCDRPTGISTKYVTTNTRALLSTLRL